MVRYLSGLRVPIALGDDEICVELSAFRVVHHLLPAGRVRVDSPRGPPFDLLRVQHLRSEGVLRHSVRPSDQQPPGRSYLQLANGAVLAISGGRDQFQEVISGGLAEAAGGAVQRRT